MLWQGGAFAGQGAVLIGTSITALLTLLGIKSQTSISIRAQGMQAVVFFIYAPLLVVAVNALPALLDTTKANSWLVLVLALATATLVHYSLVSTASHSRASFNLTNKPPVDGAVPAYVKTHSTTSDYHNSVVALEEGGQDFALVQYRIAPYFLPPEAVEHIAQLRFGAGNPLRDRYIDAQAKRRKAFFQLIARGAQIREIYPRNRLMNYVTTGTHFGELWPLTPDLMERLLREWQRAIVTFPNYTVAIADESIPMKYHVIDGRSVILHEPVGRGDSHRLNSVFILDPTIGSRFAADFDLVWGLIDPRWRDAEHISAWIDDGLIPAAKIRLESPRCQDRW
jgi:hypothetical protein